MSIAALRCANCGATLPNHYAPCSQDWTAPQPLTESDIRRIVLDVLERVASAAVNDAAARWRWIDTIAAVRKELGL